MIRSSIGSDALNAATVLGASSSSQRATKRIPAATISSTRETLPALGREAKPERDEHDARDDVDERRTRGTSSIPAPRETSASQQSVNTANTSPCAVSARNEPPNCGSRLMKKTGIFGFARLLTSPCRYGEPGRSAARGRRAPAASRDRATRDTRRRRAAARRTPDATPRAAPRRPPPSRPPTPPAPSPRRAPSRRRRRERCSSPSARSRGPARRSRRLRLRETRSQRLHLRPQLADRVDVSRGHLDVPLGPFARLQILPERVPQRARPARRARTRRPSSAPCRCPSRPGSACTAPGSARATARRRAGRAPVSSSRVSVEPHAGRGRSRCRS